MAELSLRSARGRWVLAATTLGSGLAFLDATVVTIALPAIGDDLDTRVAGLTWTVNGYVLTLAALVLVGGSLGDRFGRRRIFLIGVGWFGVTSLGCALAPTVELLVAARALQGIGAALLTPGALAILQTAFRAEDRSRAIGAWSGLAGLAGAIGPFIGGWLLDLGSWRWIFLINVPVVVAVLLIAVAYVPESRDTSASGRLDYAGAALMVAGLGALSYGLSAWPDLGGGSAAVRLGIALGLTGLVAFALWESRTRTPMLPLGVFRVRRFSITNLATLLIYAGLSGVLFWLVVALQVVSGFGPLAAGLALLPVTILMMLLSPRAGVIGDRIGPRIPMTAGPLIAALGVAAMARIGPNASYVVDVLVPATVLAAGITLTVTPLTATALGALPPAQAGLASGVNNAVARTGGLLVVAALPVLTGLSGEGFGDPSTLEPAFERAMLWCAGLLATGGAVAGLLLRTPSEQRGAKSAP
jgi:EmrB/QacA subfamily drug resistance transporter